MDYIMYVHRVGGGGRLLKNIVLASESQYYQ